MTNSRLASRRIASRRLVAGLSAVAVAGSLLTGLGPAPDPEPVEALPCYDCEVTPTTRKTTTTTTKPPGTPPAASFSWTRAKRAAGANSTSDIEALVGYINSPFLVHLNGCGSKPGGAAIVSHQWSVNGQALGGCAPTWATNQQGTFTATLTVTDAAGLRSTTTQNITVKDRLIMAMGDSIASGEANPAVWAKRDWIGAVTAGAQWPNRKCHRTPNAASQQSMVQYENAHPQETVTYVNLACSGAQIMHLLQERVGGWHYAGIEPSSTDTLERPQLDQAETLMNRTGRRPDMVYLSAGANDFGFANIAEKCAKEWEWTADSVCGKYDGLVLQGDNNLIGYRSSVKYPIANYGQGRFAALAAAFTSAGIPNSKVVISQYPDPTKDTDGDFCDEIMADTLAWLGKIQRSDVIWADGAVDVLNGDVAFAAQQNGWKLVNGLVEDFQTHGYCAAEKWVTNYSDSEHIQVNNNGSLHPNAAGTARYAYRIKEAATNHGFLLP